jgi:hypothetical protein
MRILAQVASTEGTPFIGLRSLGGAAARVPEAATAYAHRRADLVAVIGAVGPQAVVEAADPKLAAVSERLAPYVTGSYANFLSTATDADLAAIYPGETRRRLALLKGRYDPGNLFAGNHNIQPA